MARKQSEDYRGVCEKPKGSGHWYARLLGPDGKEKYFRCTSKSQAKNLYLRKRAEIIEGRYDPEKDTPKPKILLRDYVQTYLKNLPNKAKKDSTIKTYTQRLNKHVLPVFGELDLSAITRPNIKEWAATLLTSLDYDTALSCVLTLSGVLSEAVEDNLLTVNPALHAGKILTRPKTLEEAELAIFTPEEEEAFFETIQKERPTFYPMALTFFRTGLRAGEVLGLHREDLDFKGSRLHVRRQWSKGQLGTPKNGKARNVDMSQGLMAALKEWIELQDLEAAHAGRERPEILFLGNTGGTRQELSYMAENWLRYKLWFPLLEKAQVRRLDLHAARHTFASRLIANGENLKYISEQLGHSSIKITVDVYGHLLPGGNTAAVDKLDRQPGKNREKIGSGLNSAS